MCISKKKRPIGVLGTSRLYKIEGQTYAFTPHFMDNNEFYINADPDHLVSEFENELNFTKKNWYYPGRPTIVVLLSHALLGTTKKTQNVLENSDASKKNLLNFFTNLRCGSSCDGNIRIKLCRLVEAMNTCNIQSLDFLINKPEVNWKRILRVAHTYQNSFSKKKLGYNKRKTEASTPGHRTPGAMSGGRTPKRKNTTFYGKSLASPLDKLHDENYFNELANALTKLKESSEPEFKLKAHEDPKHEQPSMIDSPTLGITSTRSTINKTGAVPKQHQGQTSSPHEMLSLTLGDSSQFNQAVESLTASVNLYDQIGPSSVNDKRRTMSF